MFRRYFVTTSAIVVVSFSFLITIVSVSVGNYMAKEKRSLLSENCHTVSSVATEWLHTQDFALGRTIQVVARAIEADIFITDYDGRAYICSCDEYIATGNCIHTRTPIPENIMEAARTGEYYEVGYLGGRYTDAYYTIGLPLYDTQGTVVGGVFASSPASSLQTLLSSIYKIFIISAIIPIVLIFFAIYGITFRMTRPLRLMSEAARSMAKGDFSKRIPVTSDDEIGELSVAFNQMTNSLVQLEGMRRSFVANVSHELKTPMTTIGGFIDGILDGTIEPERQSYYLGVVSDEIKRLSRLVQAMLSLAKLESGEMRLNLHEFNLTDVVLTTVISLEQRIEQKNIQIEGLDTFEKVEVTADKDLVHQVIYNLVDNAVKFTNRDGTIHLEVRTAGDAYARFIIRNTGEGIEAKDLPHIFERFYKTDKSRSVDKGGTGLGLYLVKTIVDIHGGFITVRSIPGSYTEFEVCLPGGASVSRHPADGK